MVKLVFCGQCPECKRLLWFTDGKHEDLANTLMTHMVSRPYLHTIAVDEAEEDIVIQSHKDGCSQNGTKRSTDQKEGS